MLAGFIVLMIACMFQGSFGLGMKNYRPFSWEAFWVIFSIIGILIIPIVWTWIEVPGFYQYIAATPPWILAIAAACGFLWGVSAIWYGKGIDCIGMSLTVGINTGVGCSLGSLIPLFILGNMPSSHSLAWLLVGMAVMILGVGIITRAGILKDKESRQDASRIRNPKFVSGLVMALASGFGTAAMNIGYTYASRASSLAVEDGINPVSASLIAYVIVFASGGFISNLGYALWMLNKNNTFSDFSRRGSSFAWFKALLTGGIWFAALGLYAKSTALLGDLGPVIGWIAFLSGALIISNAWGLKTGEWHGYERPKRVMLLGNAVLVLAVVIVGYANGLS